MAIEKRMNQQNFGKIVKDLTSFAEVIRSRQDQKQIIINDFDKERKRFKNGKISKKALSASVPRVRRELDRLDKQIKRNILALKNVAKRVEKFALAQAPKKFKVSMSGIKMSAKKR